MIYCVWYPSGGFGHFVNAVLTLRGKEFVRPKKQLSFSNNGNSHALDLVTPKYLHEQWPGNVEFLDDKNYCVLVDNGIVNESKNFKSVFPNSTVIKICYTDHSWPIVARTMIDKAMGSNINEQLPVDDWSSGEPWVRREKYFLFLRDHDLRHAWRATDDTAIHVDNFYDSYEEFFNLVNRVVPIEWCEDLWLEWFAANAKYIDPVRTAKQIIDCVNAKQHYDLSSITDTWVQAVVYYYIWLHFGIEVPHNDFADFFSDSQQIADLISRK